MSRVEGAFHFASLVVDSLGLQEHRENQGLHRTFGNFLLEDLSRRQTYPELFRRSIPSSSATRWSGQHHIRHQLGVLSLSLGRAPSVSGQTILLPCPAPRKTVDRSPMRPNLHTPHYAFQWKPFIIARVESGRGPRAPILGEPGEPRDLPPFRHSQTRDPFDLPPGLLRISPPPLQCSASKFNPRVL